MQRSRIYPADAEVPRGDVDGVSVMSACRFSEKRKST